jgi:hypothetical protein
MSEGEDQTGTFEARQRRRTRLDRRLPELLELRAPYLEDKLLRLGTVTTREQAHALFQEVKKYLVLAAEAELEIPMFSQRIDDAWHQFILFTRQYGEFCREFAGHFLHHEPLESPPSAPDEPPRRSMTRSEFSERYARHFGSVSELWRDELGLEPATRLTWSEWALPACVQSGVDLEELCTDGREPVVLCRAGRRARAALEFMVQHRAFLIRELPGLSTADQIALCRPLVELDVLHRTV